jgi:hypothetical protein
LRPLGSTKQLAWNAKAFVFDRRMAATIRRSLIRPLRLGRPLSRVDDERGKVRVAMKRVEAGLLFDFQINARVQPVIDCLA